MQRLIFIEPPGLLEIARARPQIALRLREWHKIVIGEQSLDQCQVLFKRHQILQVRQDFNTLYRSQIGLGTLAVRPGKPILK
ncbi:hypothetical protein D3C72_656220 [compost metagenome]